MKPHFSSDYPILKKKENLQHFFFLLLFFFLFLYYSFIYFYVFLQNHFPTTGDDNFLQTESINTKCRH